MHKFLSFCRKDFCALCQIVHTCELFSNFLLTFSRPTQSLNSGLQLKLIFRHHLSNTNDNFLLYLHNCPMFPLSIKVPDNKTDCTYYPVDHHCNPHAKYSQSHIFSYQITESDPENPHRHNRCIHTGFCISCRTIRCWKSK